MHESHGLGSVEPSYVGVVSCVLTGTCHCGCSIVGGVIRGSGDRGASSLRAGGQVAGCCCDGALRCLATAGLAESRLAACMVVDTELLVVLPA
jgi:hypothetical protein